MAPRSLILGLVLGLSGCAESEPSIVLVPATQAIRVQAPAPIEATDASRVLVTPSRKLDRPTEVVGVVDAHEASGNESAALAALRARAASIGADAVLGVEFHHGEERNEPIHLSGLAVRYLERNP